uniref:Ribosomal protein L28 n=1 Tax=Chromera velia CCMP2878 TaxID=1169474 RepID=A0A0G4I5W5_9ALVE|eukprot:Cvel_11248.t1-p1 / transcript=Cvel_11248.t1 / gene=Cvel_11248 / organism=Chromera_velia_CCMP2878 / gene_product=hypothetical protein / transcript_product=hypothetical protein / location=Cvel_scaffold701:259-2775(-) / protein_length=177 / sequence_SO=supercontig / SO=protein_coding / is_pseudo=false
MPSISSQMGLYHDEDFNTFYKTAFTLKRTAQKVKATTFKKDFRSEALNTTIPNLRVTTSALHAMDDIGGFDAYILRTPPQELRSNTGEKMRKLMYYYMEHPEVKSWGLPWKVFLRAKDQADPYFARHLHLSRKERNEKLLAKTNKRFSPYYLPSSQNMHPERQPFIEGSEEPEHINL